MWYAKESRDWLFLFLCFQEGGNFPRSSASLPLRSHWTWWVTWCWWKLLVPFLAHLLWLHPSVSCWDCWLNNSCLLSFLENYPCWVTACSLTYSLVSDWLLYMGKWKMPAPLPQGNFRTNFMVQFMLYGCNKAWAKLQLRPSLLSFSPCYFLIPLFPYSWEHSLHKSCAAKSLSQALGSPVWDTKPYYYINHWRRLGLNDWLGFITWGWMNVCTPTT